MVLSFLITADFWLELDDFKLLYQIQIQIITRVNQLKAQKQSLSLQELETLTYNSNKGIEDFINRVSYKVSDIKGVEGLIIDVTISRILLRGLPNKEFSNFKLYISSMRDNLPRLKIELCRAEATIKEEKLRTNGSNTSDSTLKALLAQSN